mmetsp:Transcript_19633/g.59436  ORF Transcript_19633/g.59436 Transcript_19633/m.59436 type:complete len:484 (-) Transcript_19633:296-1747(-)
MCRLLVYKGPEVALEDVLVRPEHNIVQQSRDASYHPGCTSKRNFRVNGDGFGVAWYNARKPWKGPCTVHFASPAWHNRNLLNICRFVDSNVVMGHVRAAFSGVEDDTVGSTFSVRVSEENCHPFTFGRYAFCHNGGVTDFPKMKRRIQASLSDEAFNMIQGNTDSEHVFAIFLDMLPSKDEQLSADAIAEALRNTIKKVLEIARECEDEVRPSSFNLAVTDGVNVVATRFRNGASEPPSLYYCYGSLRDDMNEALSNRSEGDAALSPGHGIVEMTRAHPVPVDSPLPFESEGTTSYSNRSYSLSPDSRASSVKSSFSSAPVNIPGWDASASPHPLPRNTSRRNGAPLYPRAAAPSEGLLKKALSSASRVTSEDEQSLAGEPFRSQVADCSKNKVGDTLIISSEPLTRCEENWMLVPRNSIVIAAGCSRTVASPICSVKIERIIDIDDPVPPPPEQLASGALPIFATSPIHSTLLGGRSSYDGP